MLSIVDKLSIVCNCFFPARSKTKKKQYDEIDKQLASLNGKYNIHILKVDENFHLKNLYPISDQVERWSTLIIGNDKTYIQVSMGDFQIENGEELLNKTGNNILSQELQEFFDPLWTQTLAGNQLQFYMSVSSKLYFVNTYPFVNDRKEVIGAVMFIRRMGSEKLEATQDMNDRYIGKVRKSMDTTKSIAQTKDC